MAANPQTQNRHFDGLFPACFRFCLLAKKGEQLEASPASRHAAVAHYSMFEMVA
jgi:hypothetical protein